MRSSLFVVKFCFLRCDSSHFYDTTQTQCGNFFFMKYFINYNLFVYYIIENKKLNGVSCTDLPGECDNRKGLSCKSASGIQKCR